MAADAVARAVVFLGSFFLLLLFGLFSGRGGSQMLLSALFLLAIVGVVLESSYSGRRLAEGHSQLIEGRWLIYGFLALFGIAVILVIVTSVRLSPDDLPPVELPPEAPPVQAPITTAPEPEPITSPSPAFPSPTPTVSIVVPVSPTSPDLGSLSPGALVPSPADAGFTGQSPSAYP